MRKVGDSVGAVVEGDWEGYGVVGEEEGGGTGEIEGTRVGGVDGGLDGSRVEGIIVTGADEGVSVSIYPRYLKNTPTFCSQKIVLVQLKLQN